MARFWLHSSRFGSSVEADSGNQTLFASMLAIACVASLVLPEAAKAEEITGGALELVGQLVDNIEALGPLGPLLLIACIVITELVPLFPTQPLSITSGLLFGPIEGTLITLTGCCLASFAAFFLSRGVGKSLAQKVIAFEMSQEHQAPGSSPNEHNLVAQKFLEMKQAVETGSFSKQLTAILVLRLTPVIPFSASNYVIGLTLIPFPPFALGTAIGISGYCLLYASLGGAGRVLLDGGEDVGSVLAGLLGQAGGYSETIGKGLLAVGALAGLVFAGMQAMKSPSSSEPVSLVDESANGSNGVGAHIMNGVSGPTLNGTTNAAPAAEREMEKVVQK